MSAPPASRRLRLLGSYPGVDLGGQVGGRRQHAEQDEGERAARQESSLASTMTATPAATSPHGWTNGPRAKANHFDILSTPVCHFGGSFGFFGRPILRQRRRAMTPSSTAPMAILTASGGGGRRRARLRWVVLGGGQGDGHHDGQRQDPPGDEERRLRHPTLRRQDDGEGGEGDGLEGDRQADDDEIEDEHRPSVPRLGDVPIVAPVAEVPAALAGGPPGCRCGGTVGPTAARGVTVSPWRTT